MKTCGMCEGIGFIYLGTQYAGVDHATLAPIYCDTLERCDACDGSGQVETPVSSEDWTEYERVMQAEAGADFAEACAGLDSWYRAQGAAA